MKKPKKLPRHYSGPGSMDFWDLVNDAGKPDDVRHWLYLQSVILQNIESEVLRQLEAALEKEE